MTYKIALIPGDGIGTEVCRQAVKVLHTIETMHPDIRFQIDTYDWGCDYYRKHGKMMDEDGLKKLQKYDAIMLGAVGHPDVPDAISLRGLLLKIRQGFDQYVNIRPVKLLRGVDTPLKDKTHEDIDFIVIRENSEGEYAGAGDIINQGHPDETVLQTSVFSRRGTERIIRYAYDLARKLNKPLTSVSKANALNYSMVFWDKMFQEVGREYPDVKTNTLLVDAAAMFFVKKPERFGVVVTSNLFGDILTDLGAAIAGGMGVAAGANINPERKYPSMFEPIHGSAPDIAGKNIANPFATIWSVSQLMDHLGHEDIGKHIIDTMETYFLAKEKMPTDFGGNATTDEIGDHFCELLKR